MGKAHTSTSQVAQNITVLMQYHGMLNGSIVNLMSLHALEREILNSHVYNLSTGINNAANVPPELRVPKAGRRAPSQSGPGSGKWYESIKMLCVCYFQFQLSCVLKFR